MGPFRVLKGQQTQPPQTISIDPTKLRHYKEFFRNKTLKLTSFGAKVAEDNRPKKTYAKDFLRPAILFHV